MSEDISVFGLGYVGLITSLGLADQGHRVVGVDIAEDKVERLNNGSSTIKEQGVAPRLEEHLDNGRFHATTDAGEATEQTTISIVCVGTPTGPDGTIDLRSVENVCRQIGRALNDQTGEHTVLLRSTVLPGTSEKAKRWLEDTSQRSIPDDVHYIYQPEFMREGSAFKDFYDPPFTVFGPPDDRARETIDRLYPDVDGSVLGVELGEAEFIKYACNAFHALKISFANEIGRLAEHHDIDGSQIMDVLCRDQKLNVSDAYLDPGFAFGGSCLPKDLSALCRHAEQTDVDVPVIRNIMNSNDRHLDFARQKIEEFDPDRVGVIGLTFKADTDDVRESPMVKLCAHLAEGKDVEQLRIYEPALVDTTLHGANRLFIERTFPGYREHLVDDIDEVLTESDTLLLGPASDGYVDELTEHLPGDLHIIDTAGHFDQLEDRGTGDTYHSIL